MKPHFQYLWYVLQHKWFVFIECCKLGIPWAGVTHDLSKFSPREWTGYVAQFFWSKEKRGALNTKLFAHYGLGELVPWGEAPSDWFTIAWNHHQNRNPHHWDYWLHRKKTNYENGGHSDVFPLPMPVRYMKEMIADWRAMSRKFKNDPTEWYLENRDKMLLREETRAWIEERLGVARALAAQAIVREED